MVSLQHGRMTQKRQWLVRAATEQYVQKTLARWRSAGLDLLVLPGFACPPPPRGQDERPHRYVEKLHVANRIFFHETHGA